MKKFKTINDAKEYGKHFSKHQYDIVMVNDKKVILCGTDMAYEEAIWGGIYEILKEMYIKFAPNAQETELDSSGEITDKTSEIRDDIIKWFEDTFHVQFVDVYNEY